MITLPNESIGAIARDSARYKLADHIEQRAADLAEQLRCDDVDAAIRAATALRAAVDWIGMELIKKSIAPAVEVS
ncbi:hypothetical protein [Anatilimnocola floriformis]|uniref:hypothetical protein n=1 Tax=Anatilimnocola floriformis TaxID=2948575 RepID=UPI0020C28420|nr:hypothetical protein [Anatilimnocola floriformis]